MTADTTHAVKLCLDVAAVGTTVATIAGWLPNVAALFTIIWTLLRIYESKTVQGWLKRDTGNP